MSNETATKRIPVTPSVFEVIRDLKAGANMEYSDLLQFLYGQYAEPDETALDTGARIRKQRKQSQ